MDKNHGARIIWSWDILYNRRHIKGDWFEEEKSMDGGSPCCDSRNPRRSKLQRVLTFLHLKGVSEWHHLGAKSICDHWAELKIKRPQHRSLAPSGLPAQSRVEMLERFWAQTGSCVGPTVSEPNVEIVTFFFIVKHEFSSNCCLCHLEIHPSLSISEAQFI